MSEDEKEKLIPIIIECDDQDKSKSVLRAKSIGDVRGRSDRGSRRRKSAQKLRRTQSATKLVQPHVIRATDDLSIEEDEIELGEPLSGTRQKQAKTVAKKWWYPGGKASKRVTLTAPVTKQEVARPAKPKSSKRRFRSILKRSKPQTERRRSKPNLEVVRTSSKSSSCRQADGQITIGVAGGSPARRSKSLTPMVVRGLDLHQDSDDSDDDPALEPARVAFSNLVATRLIPKRNKGRKVRQRGRSKNIAPSKSVDGSVAM